MSSFLFNKYLLNAFNRSAPYYVIFLTTPPYLILQQPFDGTAVITILRMRTLRLNVLQVRTGQRQHWIPDSRAAF